MWKPLCGFQAAVDGALPVHGCGSVHAAVELREDVLELHHLTGHYPVPLVIEALEDLWPLIVLVG